uniref:Uncharacterized protein n=1 Tax=Arundo donax TaxID=35708 RepID=A0A0A9A0S4_ARUDO
MEILRSSLLIIQWPNEYLYDNHPFQLLLCFLSYLPYSNGTSVQCLKSFLITTSVTEL